MRGKFPVNSPQPLPSQGPVPEAAQIAQDLFTRPYFRVYTNPDLIGVELGGAIKNVMAIAAGTSDGLGFGHSTRAALITRGLAEMTRLGLSMGAEAQTFFGLAGLGDLVLTCTGDLSRNRQVGLELGRGRTLQEILAGNADGRRRNPDHQGLAGVSPETRGGDAHYRKSL